MSYKKVKAMVNTKTVDREQIIKRTGNIYESIIIMSKRANQVNAEMKGELLQKINEFSQHTDNLDEIFENREQIEVSRYYEQMPKPTQIAIQEWLNDDIYYRYPEKEA